MRIRTLTDKLSLSISRESKKLNVQARTRYMQANQVHYADLIYQKKPMLKSPHFLHIPNLRLHFLFVNNPLPNAMLPRMQKHNFLWESILIPNPYPNEPLIICMHNLNSSFIIHAHYPRRHSTHSDPQLLGHSLLSRQLSTHSLHRLIRYILHGKLRW